MTTEYYKNMPDSEKEYYHKIFREYVSRLPKSIFENIDKMSQGSSENKRELETYAGAMIAFKRGKTKHELEEHKSILKDIIDGKPDAMKKAEEFCDRNTFKGEKIEVKDDIGTDIDTIEFLTEKILEGYIVVHAYESIISGIEKEVGLKFIKLENFGVGLAKKDNGGDDGGRENEIQELDVFLIKRDKEFRDFFKNVPDDELDFEHMIIVMMPEVEIPEYVDIKDRPSIRTCINMVPIHVKKISRKNVIKAFRDISRRWEDEYAKEFQNMLVRGLMVRGLGLMKNN